MDEDVVPRSEARNYGILAQQRDARAPGMFVRLWSKFKQLAGKRSALAVVDQGVTSLGNYTTTLLLAKQLSREEFGRFGILFEAMLVLNSLQMALVIYPLSVKAGAIGDREMRRLATLSLGLSTLLGICLGLLMLGLGLFLSNPSLAIMAAVALIFWQLQELLRRALIARFRMRAVLLGDSVRYLGHAIILVWLYWMGQLQQELVFVTMALASLAGGMIQAYQLGVLHPARWLRGFVTEMSHIWSDMKGQVAEFWRLGQWMLYANLTLLISMMGCTWTLLLTHGEGAVGEFQALATILRPTNLIMLGIAGLITPAATRALIELGPKAARRTGFSLARWGMLALLPYFALVLILPTQAIQFFVGRQYLGLEFHLRLFVVWSIMMYIATMLSAYLNGLEQSRRHFAAQAMYTAGALLISIPLTAIYGLKGIIVGGLCATAIQVIACAYFLRVSNAQAEATRQRITTSRNQNTPASGNLPSAASIPPSAVMPSSVLPTTIASGNSDPANPAANHRPA